jgi:NAD(P)H-dependent FMN reductase
MPTLQVIIGSTRPGRVGLPVAQWFTRRARASGLFDVEVVDLAEVDLPLFDEPHHPRLGRYERAHTLAWSATVARADAFVFVVPEYNYGFNAATKNAIDYLHAEWQGKPVGFVSYGGIAGGTRAVQMLKQVLTTLSMVTVFESVNLPFVQQMIGADGEFRAGPNVDEAAEAMLQALHRWEAATRQVRPEVPAPRPRAAS